MKTNIKVIPLGGVRQDGENLYAIQINDGIYVLDCGLKYPENEMLGIDFVIPDFTYLKENLEKIVGVFLTHGHYDAIGALPYFLKEFNVPVFGSELTIALAKLVVKDYKATRSFDQFNVIDEKREIVFDDVTVSFFRTTHSIPESMGIVLSTDAGRIVYTGDFKFDQTAQPGYKTDFAALAQLGEKGVLALLSDSRNAENYKPSVNEYKIEEYILDVFQNYTDRRIIVASAAHNLLRIQQILNVASRCDRKVFLTNRSLQRIFTTALKLNKLKVPKHDMIISSYKELAKLNPEEVVILQTGKVGEPIKAIQRMANQKDRINIESGDVVLIATTPAPAMETNVARTRDMIYRADGEVKMISDDLASSGDASRSDLQLMLNLLKPKYLFPIQGEYRMLDAHAQLAKEVGIDPDNIFLTAKGDVYEYDGEKEKMYRGNSVQGGDVMIDGIGVGDIGNIVLRDRKVLSEDGIFVAVVTINRKNKTIVSQPKITSRGFIYVKANRDLVNESAKLVSKTVQNNLNNKEFDWSHLKQDVRESLNSYLYEQTKCHPVILPVIMEVNQHRRHRSNKNHSKNQQ